MRELGELLVGRDSTAVIELVKNSYDADATFVTLDAANLGTPDAVLRVIDNGNGMTHSRFISAFLRIASRDKEGGERRSPNFKRRFTGQKGIGRLATHKLAAWLSVTSIPVGVDGKTLDAATGDKGVYAALDWDLIEKQDSLDKLDEGFDVQQLNLLPSLDPGTVFELRRLRSNWTQRQVAYFVQELHAAQPPRAFIDSEWPGAKTVDKVLVPKPSVRDTGKEDPGFDVRLTGDLEVGDDLWTDVASGFSWLLEVDATTSIVNYQITPMEKYAESESEARTYRFQRSEPLGSRPAFQARVFIKHGASARRGPLAGFVRSSSGIRVYHEGFRVLPYGGQGDDWLSVDKDYRSGPRFYEIDIDNEASDQLEMDRKEGLSAIGNQGYFGAVFLTESGLGGLRSLVNREGFVPDASFDVLVDLMRTGIQLATRVRRAVFNRVSERERRALKEQAVIARPQHVGSSGESAVNAESAAPTQEPSAIRPQDHQGRPGAGDGSEPAPATASVLQPDVQSRNVAEAIAKARASVAEVRADPMLAGQSEALESMVVGFATVDDELARLRSLQPDLRVLASVGLQLGAFVHDINGMLGQAGVVRELIEPLMSDESLGRQHLAQVRRISRGLTELTHTLARQSAYLTDVLVTDPRRRRSRIAIADRFATVRRFIAEQAARLEVTVESELPSELKTPPMFPAEVGVLLTNLMTNAVKNAGVGGRVLVTGAQLGKRGATFEVHNTGNRVELAEAERWFLPFESTTVEVNEVLGQGLGLGLPISRALVEDYRGRIEFISPPNGFATSVRVDLPDPQER